MTGREFEKLRESLGVTQAALADLLDVEARTVRRWASGASDVPLAVALLMTFWGKNGIPGVPKPRAGKRKPR
jgi:DNA-binding transcriptional regulator YiaG